MQKRILSIIVPCNEWQSSITLTGFHQEKVKTINIFANGFAILETIDHTMIYSIRVENEEIKKEKC